MLSEESTVTPCPSSHEVVPSCLVQVVVFVLSVLLDELLDEVQDMEMKLKRNIERIMSICLTWFPNWFVYKNPIYTRTWFELQCLRIILGDYLTLLRISGGYSQEMMGLDYCFIPDELYLTRKMSFSPELVLPSNPPPVKPVT